jgi:hypothetical protein
MVAWKENEGAAFPPASQYGTLVPASGKTVTTGVQLGLPDCSRFTIKDSILGKTGITTDKSKGISKVTIPHLSWIDLFNWDRVQLVLDIPGKYLLKGDLIFALTLIPPSQGNFWWFPGHVGLYLGTAEPASNNNDGNTIIESTPDFNGVSMNNSFSTFKTATFHIYMGARRFNGTTTNQNRIDIASYSLSKLGTCFDVIGWWSNDNCLSCTNLTEKAYKFAGIDIIPTLFKIPFTFPLTQFNLTKPVDEIEVNAGDLVSIPVYGVVWSDSENSYTKEASAFTAIASNLPDGATFINNIFTWQPRATDAGQIIDVGFKVLAASGNYNYTVPESLKIHVVSDGPVSDPAIITHPITVFTHNTATVGGCVTSENGAAVTARGVCYGTSLNPTISGLHTTDGTGAGAFTAIIEGLTPNTFYYLRAYATNSMGIYYGNEVGFTTH